MIPLDNDNKSVLVAISYGIRLTNYRVMCPLHGIHAQQISGKNVIQNSFVCGSSVHKSVPLPLGTM